jgi:hypothetical protein
LSENALAAIDPLISSHIKGVARLATPFECFVDEN